MAPIAFQNIVNPKIVSAEEPTWSAPINISNTSLQSLTPSITVDKSNNIHVVWEEQWRDETTGLHKRDIYYAKRDNNGWSPKSKITTTSIESKTLKSSFPKIAVDSAGKVHVAWYEEVVHQDGTWETFVDYTSFVNPQDAQPARVFGANHVYDPNLALITDSKDRIHLVWVDNAGPFGSLEDQLKHAINEGGSWTSPNMIRKNSWGIFEMDAALDSADNLHLAWLTEPSSQGQILVE